MIAPIELSFGYSSISYMKGLQKYEFLERKGKTVTK